MTNVLVAASAGLFVLGLAGLFAVFVLYPLFIGLLPRPGRKEEGPPEGGLPFVSMLVAVRNGADLISTKIDNALSLDYPADRFEIVVFSDGSSDETVKVMESFRDPRVKCFSTASHHGKAAALNEGIKACRGDIVVFSDADALLEKEAIRQLVRHYRDPAIGGVCGQRVIGDQAAGLKKAQSRYIKFDSLIKWLESRVGSVTSNDGKLYCIRRALFRPIDSSSTDDLFVSLTVISQGYRFIFDPEARARIRTPSRNHFHEIQRRRRIVSRSLRGIFLMRGLLNPFQHGVFSLGLAVNKVVRRLLPLCLILLFVSSIVLSFHSLIALLFLALQASFYGMALSYPLLSRIELGKKFRQAAALPVYFCIGNYGTLLGLLDFLSQKRVSKWEPMKTG
jgi:cellulose synthase/poly-beta-1,6-N-acetylglucosamine synthase-like glycosyltransferase